ncbi:MAG TPA: maleylpyruvate isomerase N-terminal domain-containing protein [Mycobacteriales bacterium]|jgi:hypothetical protein|nr:maleylpyruvate isomerase family mycothiol-dependent enzyme [Cryptosporangiaceae bacterium]MDQ1679073.1 hypothetical protein [Actinomycetota bacterium]HEV7756465.1 maleylpyruvate isomerase N-terminal domain-containing protein [Mycobacteriales bacterium]
MTAPAQAVLSLWDRVIALAEQAEATDWGRPTPDPEMTVRDVVGHVASGIAVGRTGTPDELIEGLRLARAAHAERLAADAAAAHGPGHNHHAVGASCLDLYVHAHDLSTALGVPVDLTEDSPAVREAARYLLHLAPRLLALRAGAQTGDTLRVGLPGAETELTVGGAELWRPDGADGSVTATPAALVLLLAGRGDPGHWRARGALDWSGSSGEAFVRKARLYV